MTEDVQRSSTSLKILCEVAQSHGLTIDVALAGTGLSPKDLNSLLFVSVEQEIQAIENVVKALEHQVVGLGAEVGQRMQVTAFGIWGFALLSSSTLRNAIEISIEYSRLSTVLAQMSLVEVGDSAGLRFELVELPEDIHLCVFERHAMVAITFIQELLQGPDAIDFRLEVPGVAEEYANRFNDRFATPMMKSDSESFVLKFPVDLLDLALPKSDPVTLQYCLNQCKVLLDQQQKLPYWSSKVRDQIVDVIGKEQKLEDVASNLAMTERTLRRRLSDEGTSFRELYSDVRLSLAYELLETARINVETVAWRVGYSEPASFTRAFVRRFGMTPGEVRKSDSGRG